MQRIVLLSLAATLSCMLLAGCGGNPEPAQTRQRITIPTDATAELREVLEALQADEPQTRAQALTQLVEAPAGEATAEPYLLNALSDTNHVVRRRAAELLGEFGVQNGIQPLIEVLQNQAEESFVRSSAAEALGRLKAVQAAEPLTAALAEMVWHVRYQAVVALERIGDPASREVLAETARYEPNALVRSALQEALDGLPVLE